MADDSDLLLLGGVAVVGFGVWWLFKSREAQRYGALTGESAYTNASNTKNRADAKLDKFIDGLKGTPYIGELAQATKPLKGVVRAIADFLPEGYATRSASPSTGITYAGSAFNAKDPRILKAAASGAWGPTLQKSAQKYL